MICRAHARSGVALVIAIAVLAALMLLALPFLFSQTASIAGARAASWDGEARRGRDRSEGLATAAAVYATGLVRTPSMLQPVTAVASYTQIPAQVYSGVGLPSYAETSWRSIVETGADWKDPGGALIAPAMDSAHALHGAIIEDESRRIDPNCLTERAWAIILAKVNIDDPYTISWSWNPGPGGGTNAAYGRWTMEQYGRLARALTWWRPAQSNRFNRIEDLLGADPNQVVDGTTGRTLGCTWFGPAGYDKTTGAAIWPIPATQVEASRNPQESDAVNVKTDGLPEHVGYRVAPLTQSELERLRPMLSFLVPGQGLSGQVDYATVVATATGVFPGNALYTDDILDPGTTRTGPSLRPNWLWTKNQAGVSQRFLDNSWLKLDDVLSIEVPPALNINTVPSTSKTTLLYVDPNVTADPKTIGWPESPTVAPVPALAELPRLRMLDPRLGDGTTLFERPALGVAGFGIVAIEGAGTALDPMGRSEAQRRRRTVVQVVPQEHPFEVEWATQADLEALVRVRQGSWVMAGPHPTNRVKDWGSRANSTAGKPSPDMLALGAAGWLEPAPVCSFGLNPAVSFDWWLPLGLTNPQAWDKVTSAFKVTPVKPTDQAQPVPDIAPAVDIPAASLQSSSVAPGRLTAQGLRLQSGDQYAFTVGADNTPLVMNLGNEELRSRHISMRFCLPDGATGLVPLLEARAKEQGRDTGHKALAPALPAAGFGTPDAYTDDQSVWRVHYDTANSMLVLVMANAALPWYEDERTRFGVTAWTAGTDGPTDAYDKRCEPGSLSFAPAWQAQRVEFRYYVKGGLVQGRWYHLEVFDASDRPGYHGLILDGIVGRDALEYGTGTFDQTGDHYTWPSLRLDGSMSGVSTTPITGNAHLSTPSTIKVKLPPKPGGGTYSVEDILPSHGVIRIDDEYFSYDAASGTQLTGVQRGRRQNTDQATPLVDAIPDPPANTPDTVPDWQRVPVTQAHNDGALVTPGWSQIQLPAGSGVWQHGGVTSTEDFPKDVRTSTFSTSGWPSPAVGQLTFPATLPKPTGWPTQGLVRFRGSWTAAYKNDPMELEWTGPGGTNGANPTFANTITSIDGVVVSIEVTGNIFSASESLFAGSGAVQFLDVTNGRCEWVRYDHLADRDAAGSTVGGKYFVRDDGWDMTPYAASTPLLQPRGSMRTPWRTDPWPAGSLVLPVQTALVGTDRFESGDIVTIVADQILNGGVRRAPVQALIRHATRDAFPATGSGAGNDTKNEWFAFAHQLPGSAILPDPTGATPAPQTVLIGRGWSGDDLSMVGNSAPRRGQQVRRGALTDAADAEGARLYLGSPAPNSPCAITSIIIDDLCAGSLRGQADANATDDVVITGFTDQGGAAIASPLGKLASDLPVIAVANKATFQGLLYGLVLIDGEVFAYRRVDDTHAVLIARGLLGSRPMLHGLSGEVQVPTSDHSSPTATATPAGRTVVTGLPVVVLPMGPVAELCSPIAVGTGFDVVEVPFGDYYKDPATFANPHQDSYAGDPHRIMQSPFVLVHDPSGDPSGSSPVEVIRLLDRPLSNQRITANWLRGLYNTGISTWNAPYLPLAHEGTWTPPPGPTARTPGTQGAGQLNPVVIGWWPRFAPGLSSGATAATTAEKDALLRSRSFAWAGFPLRLRGMRMDPGIKVLDGTLDMAPPSPELTKGIADIGIASVAGCDLDVRALATRDPDPPSAPDPSPVSSDWSKAPAVVLGNGANSELTSPFNWTRFINREIDGAEVRVHWTYATSSSGIFAAAAAQGCAPRLGAADSAAAAAPAAGTAAVKLRCVAPTRVLAVEEVR